MFYLFIFFNFFFHVVPRMRRSCKLHVTCFSSELIAQLRVGYKVKHELQFWVVTVHFESSGWCKWRYSSLCGLELSSISNHKSFTVVIQILRPFTVVVQRWIAGTDGVGCQMGCMCQASIWIIEEMLCQQIVSLRLILYSSIQHIKIILTQNITKNVHNPVARQDQPNSHQTPKEPPPPQPLQKPLT